MTDHIKTKDELTMFLLHLFVKCPLFMPTNNCIFTQEQRDSLSKAEKLELIKKIPEDEMKGMLEKCDSCYRREVVK